MMEHLKRTTFCVVAGGLLSLGGVSLATAQTDTTERLEIGTVAQELELTGEKARELAPLLETLNDVFERRQEHFEQGDVIQENLAEAYDQIAETLSATELREFHWMLRESAVGPRAGRRTGGYMMGGREGGVRGGRGFAQRGGRGDFRRGVPMRDGRGYSDRRRPMRGTPGFAGRGARPGWRFDDIDPSN
jgi:hypothetical protein